MLKSKSKIIVISGATASGKSAVAIQIAKIYNGAIINADSLQIYRDLPILSAQPTAENFKEVEHFLYSRLSLDSFCEALIAAAVGAPSEPGLRIRSPEPALIRLRFA
jgi:tRNA dimethylallyltransferase